MNLAATYSELPMLNLLQKT